jgi:hypothetical protein
LGSDSSVETIHGVEDIYLAPGLKQGDYLVIRGKGIAGKEGTGPQPQGDSGDSGNSVRGNHLLYFRLRIPSDIETNAPKRHLYEKLLDLDISADKISDLDSKNRCFHVWVGDGVDSEVDDLNNTVSSKNPQGPEKKKSSLFG